MGSRHRVYLAPDHLLLVELTGFHENYRRCFLSEIQTIVIRRTATGKLLNLGLMTIALCFLGAALAIGDPDTKLAYGIIVALLMLGVGVNFWLGPTCRCWIQTTAARHRVYALGRLRKARQCIAILQPQLLQSQASLFPTPVESPAVAESPEPPNASPSESENPSPSS